MPHKHDAPEYLRARIWDRERLCVICDYNILIMDVENASTIFYYVVKFTHQIITSLDKM